MGFKDIEAFNKSLLAKQARRIQINPKSLLAKILKARYFARSPFIDNTTGSNPSYVWRSIVWGRELLKVGSYWRVGSGETLLVYRNCWLP